MVFCIVCIPATSQQHGQDDSYMQTISLLQHKRKNSIETTLRADLRKLSVHFAKWRLKPNVDQIVSCSFHLCKQQANRRLKLKFNGKKVKHDINPKYIGVVLDHSLTYRPHLTTTQKKLKPRTNLVQKIATLDWARSFKTLRITTNAMVMSVANYCAPVWMNSCHVKMVDTQINVALRLVSGVVRPTEIEWLYVMSNIVPAEISRQEAALQECQKISLDQELPIYIDINTAPTTLRLK